MDGSIKNVEDASCVIDSVPPFISEHARESEYGRCPLDAFPSANAQNAMGLENGGNMAFPATTIGETTRAKMTLAESEPA